MTIELKPFQKEIIDQDHKWTLFRMGTGTGKTIIGLTLAEDKTLCIVEKSQKVSKNIEVNSEKFGIDKDITVISKEWFRDHYDEVCAMAPFDTIIVDECHNFNGVYPYTKTQKGVEIPKTSSLYTLLLKFRKTYPPKRFYLMSATPGEEALKVYALARLLGRNLNYFEFRDRYYHPIKKGYRKFYLHTKNNEKLNEIQELLKSLGPGGRLEDHEDIPEHEHIEHMVPLTQSQQDALYDVLNEEADPNKILMDKYCIENGIRYVDKPELDDKGFYRIKRSTLFLNTEKLKYIKQYCEQFDHVVIYARNIGSIEMITKYVKDLGYHCLTLTGQTKEVDKLRIYEEMDTLDKCVLVIQAGISAGYNLTKYRCMIFFSKSSRFLHYEQAIGRNVRLSMKDDGGFKKNTYVHLITSYKDGNRYNSDRRCHESIMNKKDFLEESYE